MEYMGRDNKYLVFYRGYNVWSTWVGTTNIESFIEATMYGVHGYKYLVFYRGYNVWSTWVGTTNI